MRTAILIVALAASVSAQVTVWSDEGEFLASTGAVAEPALPDLGPIPDGVNGVATVGNLTFTISPPSISFQISHATTANPAGSTVFTGNEIAIGDVENLNVDVAFPVTSFGFLFAEPTALGHPGCGIFAPGMCADSTFSATLYQGGASGVVVGSFLFNVPEDVPAFVGVSSPQPFDRIEFRDLTGSIDNEFWGAFWLGTSGAGYTPTRPGTGDDFVLRTAVDTWPTSAPDTKVSPSGSLTVAELSSPGGTFAGTLAFIMANVYATGFPPAPTPIPGFQLDLTGALAIPAPSGVLPVSPFGFSISNTVPPGFAGISVLLQGGLVSSAAANGTYALTDAHEFVI